MVLKRIYDLIYDFLRICCFLAAGLIFLGLCAVVSGGFLVGAGLCLAGIIHNNGSHLMLGLVIGGGTFLLCASLILLWRLVDD